ncbi:12355_t:CDS:2 [Dentiscutata heterogama]|uniref:12355_t:CDS:1 n=1 Tax=Dentiscutata heterogama TaxID=1316150 RepID=A0ACA9KJN8_9GLOM|nr:12355_t:CDS:2 [Dentiscutata heterogama]
MSDASHAHNSRHGGPQRLKVTPECRLRNPAALKNKDRSNSTIITTTNPSSQPCLPDSIEPIQNVKMKKTCARCKEATKCVKLLSSKIGKLEEIVGSLAERCRSDSIINEKRDKTTSIPEIFVTDHFGSANSTIVSLDTFNLFTSLSNCKLEDLQNLVVIMTNYTISPMHNSNNYTSFKFTGP